MRSNPFTQKEITFILNNRFRFSSRKMADKLNCSRSKIQNLYRKKGLSLPASIKEKFRREGLQGRTCLTAEMETFVLENYLTMPIKPLGEIIGKSYGVIMTRLRQLGLKIPEEIIEKRKKESQIQPGTPGWNKGMKQIDYMSTETIAKTRKTCFKKGNQPHNTAAGDGEISLRKHKSGTQYLFIRTKLGVWEPWHRVLWEKENGPIPDGYCLWFKNENTLDCKLKNLECITRAENLKRNWHEYPPQLKTAIKLTNKLQKLL